MTDPLGPQKERPWWNPSRAEEANKPGPFSPGRQGWLQNRRRKVIEEIERNRRGDYAVPTWVLFVILVAVVGALVALFTFF